MAEAQEYMSGSNVLFTVGGKGLGHSTTHTVTYSTETKKRGVKPPVKEKTKKALFSGKGVTEMSISVHGEGFRYKGEEELSLDEIRKLWGIGRSVELSCFERDGDATPYLKGKFVISKVEETSPAQDDATFTVDFENDGEPEVYPGQDGTASPGTDQA